jgi:hypothetical protein
MGADSSRNFDKFPIILSLIVYQNVTDVSRRRIDKYSYHCWFFNDFAFTLHCAKNLRYEYADDRINLEWETRFV